MSPRGFLPIVLGAVLLTGCSGDPTGVWEASSSCGDWDLEVFDDNLAEAAIVNLMSTGECVTFEYEVIWEDVANGWEFDMECDKGPCETLAPSLPAGDPGDLSMFCVHPDVSEDEVDDTLLDCNVRQPADPADPTGGSRFVEVVWELKGG